VHLRHAPQLNLREVSLTSPKMSVLDYCLCLEVCHQNIFMTNVVRSYLNRSVIHLNTTQPVQKKNYSRITA